MVAMIFNPPPDKRRRIEENTEINAAPDWASGLPKDILDSILAKLVLLSDYVRFGSVCVSWRSSTLCTHNQNRRIEFRLSSYQHHKAPLLLFPPPRRREAEDEEEEEEEEEKQKYYWERKLYSFIERKVVCENFKFQAPNSNSRCCGSSHGWLITATSNAYDTTVSITLVNPFYIGGGSQCCQGIIHLLPFEPFGGVPLNMCNLGVSKVVLSDDPAVTPNNYLVIVIFGMSEGLAFIRSGDKDWTYVHNRTLPPRKSSLISCHDVIYHKRKIYIATSCGGLAICNNIADKPALRMIAPPPRHCKPYGIHIKHYIVESPPPDSHLFLVYRYVKDDIVGDGDDISQYKVTTTTYEFIVFRLLVLGTLKSWVKVSSLGDRVLFLGDNCSTCVLASDFRGECLQKNSIYFTDDHLFNSITEPPLFHPRDMGIYNLEDHTIQPYYYGPVSSLHAIPAPVWFLPSISGK